MATATEMLMTQLRGGLAVVVAYEDRVTRDRMIRIYDRVKASLKEKVEFRFNWWRFDHLKDSELFAEAVRSAVAADLIVFSAHAGGQFPRHITAWVNAWAKQRCCRPGALGALIGVAGDVQSGITPRHFYLRQVAERTGMDFLSQAAIPLSDEQYGSVDNVLNRAAASSQLLEDILAQPHPRSFELR